MIGSTCHENDYSSKSGSTETPCGGFLPPGPHPCPCCAIVSQIISGDPDLVILQVIAARKIQNNPKACWDTQIHRVPSLPRFARHQTKTLRLISLAAQFTLIPRKIVGLRLMRFPVAFLPE